MYMAIRELWLYSGTAYATPTEMINARHNWKSPKILKRNGRMVAERMDNLTHGNWLVTTKNHCSNIVLRLAILSDR
jgi:hypothetical protein